MDIMKTDVKIILYVPGVVNKPYTMKLYVKTHSNVQTVVKVMMLTLRSAKYGIKKKKYSESNLHVISLFLKHGKQ